MLTLAVTGGIACGKSTVGSFLADEGVPVCDADDLAHAAMAPGAPVYARIVEVFGRGVLRPGGEIDRAILGARVFADPAERDRLNALVHPPVRQAWAAWLDRQRAREAAAAAVIVPLLYEIGAADGWDAVICVTARRRVQLRRLMERGLGPLEARRRLRAQMPVERKARLADYTIVNNGTRELLKLQTRKVLEYVLEK
jgi:dephospho-CoA kinase